MSISRVSLFIVLSASLAFGQGSQLPKYTVATLPSATSNPTMTVQVINGTSQTDCTVGGGSYNVICTPHAGVWVSVTPSSGSTTNSLTANSSGGAAPGDAFNGSAAKTWDYHTFGAQQALTLTTTGTSGPATLSSGALNIPQYSAGGSGVQYNPSTTGYFVISTSAIYDDNDGFSRSIGVPSSVSCVHTATSTCTVTFAVSHGLAIGGALDMSNLASWPASPAGAVQQSAQYGSFQVTTVPSGTQITFTTPTTLTYTCGPCTGTVYDASLWGIWQFAKQPFIYGHGTVYGIETSTQSAAANLATWLAGISATPLFVIDQTGQNDFAASRTVNQVETDHQTVWAAVHTAGGKVIQTSMIPASYGLTGQTTKPAEVNAFYYQNQGHTTTTLANGQYIDMYADTATAYLNAGTVSPDPAVNPIFGQVVNQLFSTQGSIPVQPPDFFSYSVSTIGGNSIPANYIGVRQLGFYNNSGTWTQMYDWNPTTATGMSFNVPVSLTTLASQGCIGTNGSGTIVAGTGCGTAAFSAITGGTNTTAAMVVGSGASLAPTGTGTIQATNISGTVSAGTGASVTGSGTTASPYVVAVTGSGPASSVSITVANAGVTGTTLNTLTKLTGAPSTAVIAATTDTGGVIGITTAGAGTTGSATVQLDGLVNCVFPGATTAGDYVQISSGTAGNCADAGATYPTSGQVIGRVLSTNAAGGTYQINLFPAEIKASSSGGSGAWTNITGSITPTGCAVSSGACAVSGTTTTVVTFASIPAHNRMQLVVWGANSANAVLKMTVNGDTGTNYVQNGSIQTSTSAPAQNTAASATGCAANFNSLITQIIYDVPFYADTSFAKSMHASNTAYDSTSSLTNDNEVEAGCAWNNTAAITSTTWTTSTGHIAAGTKFMILVQD